MAEGDLLSKLGLGSLSGGDSGLRHRNSTGGRRRRRTGRRRTGRRRTGRRRRTMRFMGGGQGFRRQ